QLRRHAFKIGIMAQPGFERRTCDARLARIDFPRMEIKHRRSLLEAVDLADSPAAETVRQPPKETAPARSKAPARKHRGGHRDLDQRSPRQRLEGKARRVGPA